MSPSSFIINKFISYLGRIDGENLTYYHNYLEHLLLYSNENIYWLGLDGRILLSNLSQAKFFGYEKIDDFIGKNIYDIVIDLGCEQKYAKQIEENNLIVINKRIPIKTEETIYIHGKKKINISSKSPFFDDSGKTIGIFGVSIEATEIIEENKKLHSYLNHILQYSNENFYWMDLDSKIMLCNDSQAEFFGYKSAKDLIGKNIYDFAKKMNWDKASADKIRKNDLKVIQTKTAQTYEEEEFFDGEKKVMLSSKSPVLDEEGRVTAIFGLTVDISEQKKREQLLLEAKEIAEEANRAKSNFVAIVNHELRTPLTSIILMIQRLKKNMENFSDKQKEIVDNIVYSSNNLLTIVNDVLDFSKLESGLFEFNYKKTNLKKFLQAMIQPFIFRTQQKKLKFKFNYDPMISKFLLIDIEVLQRILVNLIVNAIKFTERGTIELSVTFIKREGNRCYVLFEIKDSGIGIPTEKQALIFEKFRQIDSSFSRKYNGTGLGLTIVKDLIEKSNGFVYLKSNPGKGSAFYVELSFEIYS